MNHLTKLLKAAPAVVAMLVLQMAVLFTGLGTYHEITIFCTGPATGWVQWTFALLHLSFLGLLALGMASLAWRAARPAYLILIFLGLAALPLQAMLVHSHVLKCDLP
jgi:hypothetical protein